MASFIALLRAVNVGGTGKLPMSELKTLCERAGLERVRTYIASGNVIFDSDKSPAHIKREIEAALKDYAGKPVGVLVRTAAEMAAIVADNPFPDAKPEQTLVIFLDHPASQPMIDAATGAKAEEIRLGRRELYVHYPEASAEPSSASPPPRPAPRATSTRRPSSRQWRRSAEALTAADQ